MGKRAVILGGMAAGVLWSIAIMALGREWHAAAHSDFQYALVLSLIPPGLVLAAMIGRLAARRFFDDTIIDGQPFAPGSGPEIDQRVLRNTVEQLVLALCLWPFIGMVLGHETMMLLGVSFALTRVLFWIGYHVSPPLRGFGFAAGFYPTVLLALLALAVLPGL